MDSVALSGIEFAQSLYVSVPLLVLAHESCLARRVSMRKTRFFEMQSRKVSERKRLRELEHENGLLKVLYADLLQKFSAMKDGLTRSAGVC